MLSVKIKVTNIIIMMDLLQHNEPITCNMAPYKDLFISLSSLPLSIAICYVQKQKKQQATYRHLYIQNLLIAVCARRPCGDPGAGVRQAGVQLPGPGEGAVAHRHHRHGGDLHQVTTESFSYPVLKLQCLEEAPTSALSLLSYVKYADTLVCKDLSLFKIEEAYIITSGCVTDTEWAEQLATHTEWCHCREPRCNGDTGLPQHSDYQHNHVDSSGLQVTTTHGT